jgi:hypothetical protein
MNVRSLLKNDPILGRFLFGFEACFEAWVGISFNHQTNLIKKRMFPMKNKFALLATTALKINSQHIQLFFAVLALAMLVVGVGAPDDGGGFGR